MPIRRLSPSLVNKIAAGEVIERPASVVKELIENAVDAGARRIDVSVSQGGLELIRVVDDGCGIPADELPLALASHATSKISSADDLFRVGTLGFRGEALASIAEVSRLTLRSRTRESDDGAELEAVGGTLGEVAPCGCPVGTTVEARNLFFNTPVRRKFLRAAATEFGHVSEAVTRVALAAPDIHFTLRHNDKPVMELPSGGGWLERIARVFGRELAEALIWVENTDGDVTVSGYVANPAQNRSHNRMQYIFLGGRYIRDRALQHALVEAYRGLLPVGRQPIAFLMMRMPPEMVDVNVHPTKLEVRFQDSGRLYGQLLSALRSKFLTTDLTARFQAEGLQASADDDPSGGHSPQQTAMLRQQLVDWAKGRVAEWGQGEGIRGSGFGDSGSSPSAPLQLRPVNNFTASQSSANRRAGGAAMQIHDSYLVAETDEGVTIIDQHALHERILYEQLKRRMAAGAIEMQTLLHPEAVDLAPIEAAAAVEHRELLSALGVRIEPFGGDTVLLSAYPAMLANVAPAEVLRMLLERLIDGAKRPDRGELLDELLHTMACHAAIKAGQRLAAEEIAALLEQRQLIDDAHHCPHGRPTALSFTREELDKQFRRT
jgi:DNA mismatch repair protein MutL